MYVIVSQQKWHSSKISIHVIPLKFSNREYANSQFINNSMLSDFALT